MPELPEVETVVRSLEKRIKNRTIVDINIRYKPIVNGSTSYFKKCLINQKFKSFKRRGKYILFYLNDYILVSHLRMEGKYSINDKNDSFSKHSHVIFYLDNGKQLRYNDTRKFGRFEIYPLDTDMSTFKNLGPEPFSKEFNISYVKKYVKNLSLPIKSLLLNQSFISGIGNIYADEILFASKINPKTPSNRLKSNDITAIIKYTQSILKNAIEAGGTTIRSFSSVDHITGRFQQNLKVHGLNYCKKCGSKIMVIRLGGRSTYYCPKCQKGRV